MPAREAKEVADVIRRYECWELMLELGGLADARPMTCKVTVYNHYIHTVYKGGTVWSKAMRYWLQYTSGT